MSRWAWTLAVLFLIGCGGAAPTPTPATTTATAVPPARTDREIADRVFAATYGAHSYQKTTTVSDGSTITETYVAPDRYATTIERSGGLNLRTIKVGTETYTSTNHQLWLRGPSGKAAPAPRAVPAGVTIMVLPDTLLAGVPVGVMLLDYRTATDPAAAATGLRETVSYDKATERIVAAQSTGLVNGAEVVLDARFSNYDDATNMVERPI